jgi:hypothetical protein
MMTTICDKEGIPSEAAICDNARVGEMQPPEAADQCESAVLSLTIPGSRQVMRSPGG